MSQTSLDDHFDFKIVYNPDVTDLEKSIREMYLAGMSYASIAKALDISVRTVGARIRRLRKRGYL